MINKYKSQSHRDGDYLIDSTATCGEMVGIKLTKKTSGNITEYATAPGGDWMGIHINFSGYVIPKTGTVELALACQGGWSGGSILSGVIFMKEGAVVLLKCKSEKQWLIATATGIKKQGTDPDSVAIEI